MISSLGRALARFASSSERPAAAPTRSAGLCCLAAASAAAAARDCGGGWPPRGLVLLLPRCWACCCGCSKRKVGSCQNVSVVISSGSGMPVGVSFLEGKALSSVAINSARSDAERGRAPLIDESPPPPPLGAEPTTSKPTTTLAAGFGAGSGGAASVLLLAAGAGAGAGGAWSRRGRSLLRLLATGPGCCCSSTIGEVARSLTATATATSSSTASAFSSSFGSPLTKGVVWVWVSMDTAALRGGVVPRSRLPSLLLRLRGVGGGGRCGRMSVRRPPPAAAAATARAGVLNPAVAVLGASTADADDDASAAACCALTQSRCPFERPPRRDPPLPLLFSPLFCLRLRVRPLKLLSLALPAQHGRLRTPRAAAARAPPSSNPARRERPARRVACSDHDLTARCRRPWPLRLSALLVVLALLLLQHAGVASLTSCSDGPPRSLSVRRAHHHRRRRCC